MEELIEGVWLTIKVKLNPSEGIGLNFRPGPSIENPFGGGAQFEEVSRAAHFLFPPFGECDISIAAPWTDWMNGSSCLFVWLVE